MSINLKVTDEHKKQMSNLAIETQVLNNLLGRHRAMMEKIAQEILGTNGLSTKLYAMTFSASEDRWEATLKPGVLAIPVPGGNPAKIIKN